MEKNYPQTKILLYVLRVSILQTLLITCFLTTTFAKEAFTQGVLDQKVSIKIENQTIKTVFLEIERKSTVKFIFSSKLINSNRTINATFYDESIQTVLNNLLPALKLDYTVSGKQVVIKRISNRTTVEPEKVTLLKQIKGKVRDENGQGLLGVSIVLKGTTFATISDVNGDFALDIPEVDGVLVFSFVGYLSQEVAVNSSTSILDVAMVLDEQTLSELVVVGYGTQKKDNLTAAVEMVDTKVLKNRPVKSVGEMLEGTVPNLNVTINSGAPDATPNLNIRGFTGINSSGEPLVLVDGVEQSINLINPNDIESISVLKDQAASAIYGSRAPNGVILITTKSGALDSKARVSYSINYDINSPSMLPATMNSVDYARLTNQAFNNSNQAAYYSPEVIQKMQDFIDGRGPNNTLLANGTWGAHSDAHGSTDAYGEAFRNHSSNISHNINVSGGGTKNTYYLGVGYNTKQGILDTDIDKYNRTTALLKLTSNITNWLEVGLSTRFASLKTERPNYRGASGSENSSSSDASFVDLLSYFPNIPTRNPDGSYHFLSSLTLLTGSQGKANYVENDLYLTPSVQITPLKGLRIRSALNYNINTNNTFISTFQVFTDRGNGVLSRTARSATYDGIYERQSRVNYYQLDAYAEYKKAFDLHDFTFLAGFQQELNKYDATAASRRDLYDNNIPTFSTAYGDERNISDRRYEWATRGYFFRMSYNYDSKYIVDFNSRYDASSRFSPEKRWAFFPSVSVGYNISKEKFWPLKFIDEFKITGSFGKSGNQNLGTANSDLYTYIPVLEPGRNTSVVLNNQFLPMVNAPALINSNLTWAKPQSLGFGVEWGALKNRLIGSWAWYQRTVYDQYSPPELLPEVLGAAVPNSNNGVSETRGWEVSLTWRSSVNNVLGSKLNYSIRGGLSDYIGYVVKYGEGNETGLRSGTWTAGEQFGVIYGYQSAGIAKDKTALLNNVLPSNSWYYQGDLMLKDTNGDGLINTGQGGYWYAMGDQSIIGYNYPRYKYNLFGTIDFYNFSLSILLDGVGKESRYFSNEEIMGLSGGFWSSRTALEQHLDVGGYWSLENPDAFFPRPYQGTKTIDNANTQYLLDLSHLRIRNLAITYNLPRNIIAKFKMENLALSVSMENLGFIYRNSWLDLDPAYLRTAGRTYPINKSVSFGLNITL